MDTFSASDHLQTNNTNQDVDVMRPILFSLVVALTALAGPGVFADEKKPAIDIPANGLGLLLETPNAPVGDIFGERPVLT